MGNTRKSPEMVQLLNDRNAIKARLGLLPDSDLWTPTEKFDLENSWQDELAEVELQLEIYNQ